MKNLSVFFTIILLVISIAVNFSNAEKLLRKKYENSNKKIQKNLIGIEARVFASDILDDYDEDDYEEEDDNPFELSEANILEDNDDGEEENKDIDDFGENYKEYKRNDDMVRSNFR